MGVAKGFKTIFLEIAPQFLDDALYGIPTSFIEESQNIFTQQGGISDPIVLMKVRNMIEKVLDHKYIVKTDKANIRSTMFHFHVPKGDINIRMVYDEIKSGLNNAIYAPWFNLPTMDSM